MCYDYNVVVCVVLFRQCGKDFISGKHLKGKDCDKGIYQRIENIVGDLAPNTLRNYREHYIQNIQPIMGRMLISNVKPMHCKKLFIQMDADYAGSTIRQTYIAMGTMFTAAKMNGLITKHPMDGVRFTKPVRTAEDIHLNHQQDFRVSLHHTDMAYRATQNAERLSYHPSDKQNLRDTEKRLGEP